MSAFVRGNVRMALSGVRSAKWRSVLTMLGVIVGIVAVVTAVGIGEGVRRQVAGQLKHFGSDLITVRPGTADTKQRLQRPESSDLLFGLGASAGLTIADVQAVQKADGVGAAAPLGLAIGNIGISGQKPKHPLLIATSADLPGLLSQKIAQGAFWDATEDDADVVVLGSKAATALFGQPIPLGHTLSFRGHDFTVRGIFAPFKAAPFSGASDFDNAVFMPYKTVAGLTHNTAGIFVLLAKPVEPTHLKDTMGAITATLQSTHGDQQDFKVLNSRQAEAETNTTVTLISEWILAIAAISLVIGGVGIMNIMLLSVTERMHEIGVRKAIGATSRQVLGQFMIEATVLSLVGGIVGVLLSLAIDGALYAYTDFKPVISWRAIVVATGVSLVIGIVFGTAPAIKAARKDPIEALRHE